MIWWRTFFLLALNDEGRGDGKKSGGCDKEFHVEICGGEKSRREKMDVSEYCWLVDRCRRFESLMKKEKGRELGFNLSSKVAGGKNEDSDGDSLSVFRYSITSPCLASCSALNSKLYPLSQVAGSWVPKSHCCVLIRVRLHLVAAMKVCLYHGNGCN